jgi:nucleoside-diphosphate-sugar epimerase
VRALVTGAAGFLGRHVAERLRAEGYKVAGNDIVGDGLRMDMATFLGGMKVPIFDLVVHCAGVVGGRLNIEGAPLELMTENLRLDAAMFSWAAKAQPGHLIYLSSSAIYPTWFQVQPGAMDLFEGLAPAYNGGDGPYRKEPDSTYGFEKMVGERLAEEYRAAGGEVTVVRPFSGYGADQALEYPFPSILRRVRDHEDPVTIWSDSVRDFIHVDDVVEGMLAVAASRTNEPVNLCTGIGTSFKELAFAMQMIRGGDPAPVHVCSGKPAGVAYRVGDTSRMAKYFLPKVTLEEGIERALRG